MFASSAIRPRVGRREDDMNEARPLTAADANSSRGGADFGARCRARSMIALAGSSTRPYSSGAHASFAVTFFCVTPKLGESDLQQSA